MTEEVFSSVRAYARCHLKRPGIQLRALAKVVPVLVLIGLVAFIMRVHRFLAVNSPIGRGILVVEAWIPSQSLCEAARLFQSGSYQYVVVVGSKMNASENSPNYADLAADHLEKLGLVKEKVVRIVVPYESAKRTFATARALNRWLVKSDAETCCVDVYTIGVHARKSWIIFQSVLGNSYQVGVIAGPETSYNARYWPLSCRGWWLVMRNLTGYCYAKWAIALG